MDAALATSPTPALDWWELARQWGGPAALLALGGWVSRQFVTWRKQRKAADELHALEASTLRVLADATAHLLEAIQPAAPGEERLISVDELAISERFVREKRKALWKADGNADPEEHTAAIERAASAAVEKWATRTQRIEAFKAERTHQREIETFKDGWRVDDTR